MQLRYLLQILMEAGCLEWASVAALVLQDAMAIIRIVNAARSSSNAQIEVQRLYEGFQQLEDCSKPAFAGYAHFINSIQPQIKTLYKFLGTSGVDCLSGNTTLTSSHSSQQLKPPSAVSLKHDSPPLRPSLPRTLSDPLHAHDVSEKSPSYPVCSTPAPHSDADKLDKDATVDTDVETSEDDQGTCTIS